MKKRFRSETNKTHNYESLSKQMFNALYLRSFKVRRALEPVATTDRILSPGLVHCTGFAAVGEIISGFASFDSPAVNIQLLSAEVKRVCLERGIWGVHNLPREGLARVGMWFFNQQRAELSTGYRLASGVIVRSFKGKAVSKNCVVRLVDGSYAFVFLICGLANSAVSNCALIYCKKLVPALDTVVCTRYKCPLLKDTDLDVGANQFLVAPDRIQKVYTAVLAHSYEDENQLIFAVE